VIFRQVAQRMLLPGPGWGGYYGEWEVKQEMFQQRQRQYIVRN
jgi:hypothetical protein